MMNRQIRRREILKIGAAATVFAFFGTKLGRTEAAPGRAQIDAVLRRATEAGDVPGVVALAASDKGLFYEGAFGTRDLTKGPAMTPDTIFRIASMTKAVTSVAAMQLVEAGKLDLERPIGDVLPELAAPQVLEGFDDAGAPRLRPAKRPITLRHLLTHTAGFGYGLRTGNPVDDAFREKKVLASNGLIHEELVGLFKEMFAGRGLSPIPTPQEYAARRLARATGQAV